MTVLSDFLKRQRERFIVHAPAALRKFVYRTPTDWQQLTFSEKVRWRCQNPHPDVNHALLLDKCSVKDYVQPWFPSARTYCVIEDSRELDFDSLPDTYVVKTTHSWNRSLLVEGGIIQGQNRDRTMAGVAATEENLKKLAQPWLRPHSKRPFKELQYRFVRPRLLFEEYLDPIERELHFFLFYGECMMTMVIEREFDHTKGSQHRIYDASWTRLGPGSDRSALRYDNSAEETPPPGPSDLQKLRHMCKSIDHVRADFFIHGGEMYFSEFTFTHNRGFESLLGSHETELGRHWPPIR